MLTRQNLKQETEYNTVWLSNCTVLQKVKIWNRDEKNIRCSCQYGSGSHKKACSLCLDSVKDPWIRLGGIPGSGSGSLDPETEVWHRIRI